MSEAFMDEDGNEWYYECVVCLATYDPDCGGGYCDCGGELEFVDEREWV